MPDATYAPKTYRKQGGDEFVVANGGVFRVESGGQFIGPNPSGGADYFVDLNVTAAAALTADGSSWATAYQTIAAAITASNVSIGLAANRWWARRNRIFVAGDGIEEDLTVLPEKCDIIGVGTDLYPFPRVIGHHNIAVLAVGCRFINMGFQCDQAGDLFIIPASCHGLQFVGCTFVPATGGTTKALEITDCALVKILDCRFDVMTGVMTKIFAVAISIEGTVCHETVIDGNVITATAGIAVVEVGAAAFGSIISNNIIRATDLAIDDNSDDFMVVNNRWMTDINTSTSTAGWDFNLALAAGNIQNGATGLCDTVPFTKIAE